MDLQEWIGDRLDSMEFSIVKSKLIADDRLQYLRHAFLPPRFERQRWNGAAAICVFVIYQRHLRADTRRVVEALHARGVNLVPVLTRRTSADDVAWLKERSSALLSRVHYGRDFGGYKAALLRLRALVSQAPRLFLLNDSVYVSQSGMENLLCGMLESPQGFVGATENFEGEHHLGSFCVSFGPKVLQSRHFWRFWKRYQPTNIRPHVIKRGELALSRCAFGIVEHDYRVLYSAAALAHVLARQPGDIDGLLATRRGGGEVHWPKENIAHVFAAMANEVAILGPVRRHKELNWVTSARDFAERDARLIPKLELVGRRLVLGSTVVGSQIHQNCMTVRSYLGMPLVKNDLYYRGVLDPDDLFKLVQMFPRRVGRNRAPALIPHTRTHPYRLETHGL